MSGTGGPGPSSSDPGLSGSKGSSSSGSLGADPSTALPNSGVIPSSGYSTSGEAVTAATSPTPGLFGTSVPFGAETTATSGVGGPTETGGSPFATVSDPTGVALGTSGVYAGTGEPSPFAGPVGQTSVVGPLPTSGISAPTAPSAVSAPPDPTQAQQPSAAPVPAGSGTGGLSFEKLWQGATESFAKNPLGIATAIGGLGYSMMTGPQISAAQKQLQEQAASLNAQGKQLMSYLQSGDMPEGLKKQLAQATSAAKAKVISNYAAQGMPTDPTKNSALAQQLALIDQQAIITTAQIGQQLYATGLQESGMSSQLYQTLVNLDQTQTGRIGQAIAAMAQALSPARGLTR